jgi:hypothetical protein
MAVNEKLRIRPPKAPNLPVSPIDYHQQHHEQLSNALRLYFNQIDNFASALSGTVGGAYLQSPHIGASDTTDQYATADNTPTIVKWNTLDSGLGFTLASNTATANYSGVYKIDYSLQYANTDNAQHDIDVWLRINGVDLAGSTSKISIPARKSAILPTYTLAVSFVMFTINAGDDIELYWATDKAFVVSPAADGVYMEYKPAQTSPFAHPSIPSAIGTITFVSAPY